MKRGYKGLQNPHSNNNDFNALSFLVTSLINKMATTELVVIKAVSGKTVDVQPLVLQVDGNGRGFEHGIIHNLPFLRLQGGFSGIKLDPVVGDIGLVVFAGRDISSVKANAGPALPASNRRFDWADGVYVPGLLNQDPTQFLEFTGAGIRLKSPYPVTIETPQTVVTGAMSLGTPLAISYGGTQATSASQARSNLNVPAIDGSGAGGVWPIGITGVAAGGTTGPVIWSQVSGTGRPSDYADVTANSAAMIAANAELVSIGSDSVLSKGEKPRYIRDWDTAQAEYTPWVAQATALSVGAPLTGFLAAYSALSTYLAGLTNWTVVTVDTAINGTTFKNTWLAYLSAKEALATACANAASLIATWGGVSGTGRPDDYATVGAPPGTYVGTTLAETVESKAAAAFDDAADALASAASANAELAALASDDVLSPVEKPSVILDYGRIVAEQPGITAQATAYGITSEKTAYTAAIAALTSYLNGLGAWNNTNVSTSIDGAEFRGKFSDVYGARQVLLNKTAAVAGTLASWGNVNDVPINLVALTGTERIQNSELIPRISRAELGLTSFVPNNFIGCFVSNLAALDVQPYIVDSTGASAWNEHHLRNEFCPLIFDTFGFRRVVSSMAGWFAYWFMPLGTKLSAYPFDHFYNIAGKWWHAYAGTSTILNVDNNLVLLQEAEKRGAGVVLGTVRTDLDLFNDKSRIDFGFQYISTGTLSASSVGTGRILTLDFGVFSASDVNKTEIIGDDGVGRAVVTGWTAADNVTLTITAAFASTTLSPKNWRKVEHDLKTNGARLDLSAATVGTARTATFTKESMNSFYVGQVVFYRHGAGKFTVTSVAAGGLSATVDITEAFGSTTLYPHTWALNDLVGGLNLINGQTIQQRIDAHATLTLQICAQLYETYGSYDSFMGFYTADESDNLEAAAPILKLLIKDGIGGWPALSTYKKTDGSAIEVYHSCASPYDVVDDRSAVVAGAALATTGLTHLVPQDTTGSGADLVTGNQGWIAGHDANIAALPEHARLLRVTTVRAGCAFFALDELWQMDGVFGYTNAYPCNISRLRRQFSEFGSRSDQPFVYQGNGFFCEPWWTLKPKQNQYGLDGGDNFQTLALDLTEGLKAMRRSPSAVASSSLGYIERKDYNYAFSVVNILGDQILAQVNIREAPNFAYAELEASFSGLAGVSGTADYVLKFAKGTEILATSVQFHGVSGGVITPDWVAALSEITGDFEVTGGAGDYFLLASKVPGSGSGAIVGEISTVLKVKAKAT